MHLVYEIRQEVDHHLFPDPSFNFDFIFLACLLGKFNNQLVNFFVHAAKKNQWPLFWILFNPDPGLCGPPDHQDKC